MNNFDEYKRLAEPDKKEKLELWQIAIGLQDVDGLKPSDYLIETAKLNIDGKITIDDVKERLNTYYKTREERSDKEERTEEADKVSAGFENDDINENKVQDKVQNKVQNDILKILEYRPNITQKELAQLINKSERTIKTIMTAMQEQNLITRSGSKKTGYWKILPK